MGICNCRKTEKKELEYLWTENEEGRPLLIVCKGESRSPASLAPLVYMPWFQRTLFSFAFDDSLISLKQLFILCEAPRASSKWFDGHIRERLSLIFEIEEIPKKCNPFNIQIDEKTISKCLFWSGQIFDLQTDEERASLWHNAQKYIFIRNIVRFAPQISSLQNLFSEKSTPYFVLERPFPGDQFATFGLRGEPWIPFYTLWSEVFTIPEAFTNDEFNLKGLNKKEKPMTFKVRPRLREVIADGWHSISDALYSGMFGYFPEMNTTLTLLKGSYFEANGIRGVGKMKYYPQINQMGLDDGRVEYPSGDTEEGKFGYIPELDRVTLIDGLMILKNGRKWRGKLKYYPQINKMSVDEGWREYPSGYREEGKWGYIAEINGIKLLEGSVIKANGKKSGGRWKYYPQMNRMDLDEGWREYPKSGRKEGKWGWSPERKKVLVSPILFLSTLRKKPYN